MPRLLCAGVSSASQLLDRAASRARARARTDNLIRQPTSARRARALPLLCALAACSAGALAAPPSASAHALLVGTSPVSGATVTTQPKTVIFKFNQSVGGTIGAVRVYDSHGTEVDDLDVAHPDGHERWIGVGLEAHLPDGTYTATYRVISADTHIVYGGLVFDIGHTSAPSNVTVAGLLARNESGRVTKLAFGVVRALDYASIALMLGGLAFLALAWLPGLARLADRQPQWIAASRAFASRLALLLYAAVLIGLLASVLGVLLQGASASGMSLWASLKGTVVRDTLESRFGIVWALRALDWLAIGGLLLGARASRGGLAEGDADGAVALTRSPPRALLAALALGSCYLALTPALAGHASIESPVGVFFPSDVIHVLAASVWVGAIACLLLALPRATRELDGPDRSRLLLATLARFSPAALASVIAIAITGVVQAYIDVRTLHGLLHSTYGALIIVKTILLALLIALGAINRERLIPALRRVVGAGATPGAAGLLARRTMRGELALMLAVFGVTTALVSYAPPIDLASGPFSTSAKLGPAELELTVEPARVGANTLHLYLIDAKTGAPFTRTTELTVTARLPSKGIGPLPLHANKAGPGHYILASAVLSPAGTWRIRFTDRISEFEENSRTIAVPIE
jgi:copper transport protein